jgi:hypothetical protein
MRCSIILTGCLLFGTFAGAKPEDLTADKETLKAAKVQSDGPSLLKLFRSRTMTPAVGDEIQALIRQLGDKSFPLRQKASAALVAKGAVALPLLRAAVGNSDIEVGRRASACARRIEDNDYDLGVLAAATRLLGAAKPPGTAEVLLAYLPFTGDDVLADEIRTALRAAVLQGGKPDPVLIQALTDPAPLKRGAAGAALASVLEERAAVRKLLKDADPLVRLRVSLGLARARDREAVPVLIDLLANLNREQGWLAEDVLLRLAGEQAPPVSLGDEPAERKKCRDAWAAWWESQGPKVDLGRLQNETALLGYTLVIVFNWGGNHRVAEFDAAGKPRWNIANLPNPVDAYILPGNRVLIADYSDNRVTERNFKGEVLWQKQVQGPINAQRMPNGNTFIATMSSIMEVDKTGKEVMHKNMSVWAARKYPNGQIAIVTREKRFIRLDASGKELHSVPVTVGIANSIGGVDFLPNGRVLTSLTDSVAEYDLKGKIVWQAKVPRPDGVTRLVNGNTLVACTGTREVIELNRQGKAIRTFKLEGGGWLARRR